MAGKKQYHCVAFVHRGKVSGYLSCSSKHERAVAHLTALQDRGMQDIEVVMRSSKPKGVKAPPKGRPRTQGSLFAKESKGNQQSLFGSRRRRR